MLTEKNLGGLKVLCPQVIDTAGRLTSAQRKAQAKICKTLIAKEEGKDRAWLQYYKDCLECYEDNQAEAAKASFQASLVAPSFVTPAFCESQRIGGRK